MAKIKGVDLLATLAADLEKAEAEAEARRQARAAATGGASNLLYLPLDSIEPDPDQPRRIAGVPDGDDPHALDDLSGSILAHGIIQPITVRPLGQGRYRIVTGERRWRAAQIALQSGQPCQRKGYDLGRIPAVLVAPESATDQLEMQMVENLARVDMTPLDTAKALQKLLDTTGVPVRELARRLGRSHTWVLHILNVATPEAGEISNRIGVPLDAIGPKDLSRMKTWLADGRQAILEAVRKRIAGGETYSRSLVDEEADRYEWETVLHLHGRGFSLSDLRLLKSWQTDPEKADALARVQSGMGIAEALSSGSAMADETPMTGRNFIADEPAAQGHEAQFDEPPLEDDLEDEQDIEDGHTGNEPVPESWNNDVEVVGSEIGAAEPAQDEAPVPATSPHTESKQTVSGRIEAVTVKLPGELVAQIFTKAAMPIPAEIDQATLLSALRHALASSHAYQ